MFLCCATPPKTGLKSTRQGPGIAKFIKRYKRYTRTARVKGSGRPAKVTPRVKAEQMRADDETTTVQLCSILHAKGLCHVLGLHERVNGQTETWRFPVCSLVHERVNGQTPKRLASFVNG